MGSLCSTKKQFSIETETKKGNCVKLVFHEFDDEKNALFYVDTVIVNPNDPENQWIIKQHFRPKYIYNDTYFTPLLVFSKTKDDSRNSEEKWKLKNIRVEYPTLHYLPPLSDKQVENLNNKIEDLVERMLKRLSEYFQVNEDTLNCNISELMIKK